MKYLLFALSISIASSAHAHNSASAPHAKTAEPERQENLEQPRSIAYLTSWGLTKNASQLLIKDSQADAYLMAFARWDERGNISSSDDIVQLPAPQTKPLPVGYMTWTQLALASPHTKMIISFGGQDYEDIWNTMGSAEHIEIIANNIARLLEIDFPVYQQKASQNCTLGTCEDTVNYEQIGTTQLSGVDFDFEQASRLTLLQNQQLALLAKRVRALVGKRKSIVLTSYHVGADALDCDDSTVFRNCSFIEPERSKHHGEVLSLLQSTLGVFDFYNVMAYDAGRNFQYKIAMSNYLNAIGDKSKLRLGMSINQQWGQFGGFVMPMSANNSRATWQAKQQYGGFFVWALGANTESRGLSSQIDVFNSLVESSKLTEQ